VILVRVITGLLLTETQFEQAGNVSKLQKIFPLQFINTSLLLVDPMMLPCLSVAIH